MNYRNPLLTTGILLFLILSAGCTGSAPASSSGAGASPAAGTVSSGTGTTGLGVTAGAMESVLTSTYLQLPNLDITFIDVTITNPSDTPRVVTVESEIPGYTGKSINTVEVPAHGNITVGQTPTLRTSAIPREITPASLHYRVALTDGTLIDEQSIPVQIYPKETMVWGFDEDGTWIDMTDFIAAWVTPHEPAIDTLVRKAAEYHPEKSMAGYQCGDTCTDAEWVADSNAQVKAIFTALRNDYHITYINSPTAFGKGNENPQRIRLPQESLSSGSANCIDGAVLYASAIESIGMHPHIITTPSHAFTCYDAKPDADDSDNLICLETTMTSGDSTFEQALEQGTENYHDEIGNGNFETSASQDLDIARLREDGILPMQ